MISNHITSTDYVGQIVAQIREETHKVVVGQESVPIQPPADGR